MGCTVCGSMFDPAPVSPQALEGFNAAVAAPSTSVREPTLRGGVMTYPEGDKQPDAIDGFERTGLTVLESVMPPCVHRYEIMAMDRTGVTTVKHTCLHALSGFTNQYVTKATCDGCPLRKGK